MTRHRQSSRSWVSSCFRHSSRKVLTLAALLIMLACLGRPGEAAAQFLPKGNGNLRVMTYNVDEGTDFLEIQQATNLNQFLVAVGQTITQVRATNSPARMQAVAKQIIAAGPALVSLQELDEWYTAPFNPITGACGSPTLEFNFIQELQDALVAQGAHYTVAKEAQQYAFPLNSGHYPSKRVYLRLSSRSCCDTGPHGPRSFEISMEQSAVGAIHHHAAVSFTGWVAAAAPSLGFGGRYLQWKGVPFYWHASGIRGSGHSRSTGGRAACRPSKHFPAGDSGDGLQRTGVSAAARPNLYGFLCGGL